jgi:beta-N-acetylhexosaminidase
VFGASAGTTPFSRFFARKEKEILARMTLEEKVGQLLVFGFQGKTLDGDFEKWLASGRLGNIKIFLRNVEGRAQVKELTRRVVELEKGSRNGIPPFIATDMEGGTVNHVRYPGIRLAPAAGLVGATGETESARVSSRLIALTLSDIGVNMNFAPCADVLTEPRNMVIMTRSYGSDPELVSGMVKAFVEEHTKAGILPVMKHFPGHGMTGFDSHVVSDKVDVSRAQMMKVHLLPYERLIREKVIHACMTAHIIYSELDPEHPATFSRKIIDGLLRNELGFDGLV